MRNPILTWAHTGEVASARGAIAAVAIFVVLFCVTVPETTADTPVYVDQVLTYHQHLPDASPLLLWEFGHLLWRPIGYSLWLTTHRLLSSWSGGNAVLEITAGFIGLNFCAGAVVALLLFLVCRRFGLTERVALAVTAGFMLFSTTLNYIHSGAPYNLGLAAQLGGLLLILRSGRTPRSPLYALFGGAALALSFLLWFPYVLTVPAVLLAGLVVSPAPRTDDRLLTSGNVRTVAVAAAVTAIVGFAVFCAGASIAHIASYPALKQWILASAHGFNPERRWLRFPTGFTRSFLHLGYDGIIIKRFALGDPYAPVSKLDLIRAGMWKVAVIFVAFAFLCANLVRRRELWPALAVFAAGFVPTVAFAILLFDTSEPARYEPAYPSLLVALCGILMMPRNFRTPRWSLIAFLVIIAVVNLKAYAWDLRSIAANVTSRAILVHEHTGHNGVAFLLSFRDPVSSYLQRVPFSPLNEQAALPLFHVIEPGNMNVATWKTAAACRILQAWDAGGETWLSVRLLAATPKAEWLWVEQDDSRVHWTDIPEFFTHLETDAGVGDEDGFSRIAQTETNRKTLQKECVAFPSR
jgi:hypothetical protein